MAVLPQDFFASGDDGNGGGGEAVGVGVRGGVHEVDLRRRVMRPCYWPSNSHRVLRGTWFAEKGSDWVPLKVGWIFLQDIEQIKLVLMTASGGCGF